MMKQGNSPLQDLFDPLVLILVLIFGFGFGLVFFFFVVQNSLWIGFLGLRLLNATLPSITIGNHRIFVGGNVATDFVVLEAANWDQLVHDPHVSGFEQIEESISIMPPMPLPECARFFDDKNEFLKFAEQAYECFADETNVSTSQTRHLQLNMVIKDKLKEKVLSAATSGVKFAKGGIPRRTMTPRQWYGALYRESSRHVINYRKLCSFLREQHAGFKSLPKALFEYLYKNYLDIANIAMQQFMRARKQARVN